MPILASTFLHAATEDLIPLLEEYSSTPHLRTQIEAEIWRRYGVRCAILFTDLAGYSGASSAHGVVSTLAYIHGIQKMIFHEISVSEGEVIKTMGDSLIAVFHDASSAMECALRLIRLPQLNRILTIGIGYGDVLKLGNRDVFGPEVNHASFLAENFGLPGQTLVTDSFKEALPIEKYKFLLPINTGKDSFQSYIFSSGDC